jgi:MoxR-like ATPase
MEEGRVTVDGISHDVSAVHGHRDAEPHRAGRNPSLPEAQLDRFIMKTSIGYPDHASTV